MDLLRGRIGLKDFLKKNGLRAVLIIAALIFAGLAVRNIVQERREAAAYQKLRESVAAVVEEQPPVEEPEVVEEPSEEPAARVCGSDRW